MPKYQYNINGRQFNSKKSIIEHVRENIYRKYSDYELLIDEHLYFMLGLLRYHPWSDQKIGVGVQSMWVQPNENYATKCFWLERIDGTKTDFSFHQCVSLPSPLRDFKAACRRAIAPSIINLKQKYFSGINECSCPLLGITMTMSTSHVDHMSPNTFEKILNDFIKEFNIDVEAVPLVEHNDGKIGNCFDDVNFEKEWVDFHDRRAKLRVISIKANLSI